MKFVHVRTPTALVAVPAQYALRLRAHYDPTLLYSRYLEDFATTTRYSTYDLLLLLRLPHTFIISRH